MAQSGGKRRAILLRFNFAASCVMARLVAGQRWQSPLGKNPQIRHRQVMTIGLLARAYDKSTRALSMLN